MPDGSRSAQPVAVPHMLPREQIELVTPSGDEEHPGFTRSRAEPCR